MTALILSSFKALIGALNCVIERVKDVDCSRDVMKIVLLGNDCSRFTRRLALLATRDEPPFRLMHANDAQRAGSYLVMLNQPFRQD
jgi:hypothetical protein